MGGSSPNSDLYFFGNCVFFVFSCVASMFLNVAKKKLDREVVNVV